MLSHIVDSEERLEAFLTQFAGHTTKDYPIFVNLKRGSPSEAGNAAILLLLVPPEPTVHIFDIPVLGHEAFNLTTDSSICLKSILESKNIFKVFFDAGNICNKFHASFNINCAGIVDLRIIEYAIRRPGGKFVDGLANCVKKYLPRTFRWVTTKPESARLSQLESEGKHEVLLGRPLPENSITCWDWEMTLMLQLFACYGPKLHSSSAAQIQNIIEERIGSSEMTNFKDQDRYTKVGPSIQTARAYAHIPISPAMTVVCPSNLSESCQLDDISDAITGPSSDIVETEPHLSATSNATTISSGKRNFVKQPTLEVGKIPVLSLPLIETSSVPGFDHKPSDLPESSFEEDEFNFYDFCNSDDNNVNSDQDFTACSAGDCGCCGKCPY